MPLLRLSVRSVLHAAVAAAALACAGALAASSDSESGLLDPGPPPFAFRQSLFSGYVGDRVGSAVAMSGGLLATGVPGADAGATVDAGRVDLYTWVAELGQWMPMMSIHPFSLGLTPTANARFGAAVALSGEWLLIGCPGCAPADEAKAILLRVPEQIDAGGEVRGDFEWYRATPPELAAFSDPLAGTGAAVALSVVRSGSLISPGSSVVFAVGSPEATYGVLELGAVAMGRLDFGSNDVVWESGPWYGGVEFGKYGHSLALAAATWIDSGLFRNERYLVVGQPAWVAQGEFGVHGRAYLWQRDGVTWNNLQTFESTEPGAFDGLGSAVAVERNGNDALGTIAIGAPGREHGGTPGGAVRIYRQQVADGPYAFDAEIQHPDAALYDRFGGALALAEGRLLVGADGRDTGAGENTGAAYVYSRRFVLPDAYYWTLRQELLEPSPGGANAAFGSAVALGPRAAAVGAPPSDAANLVNAGTVATYLCDRIFSDGHDGFPPNGCNGP